LRRRRQRSRRWLRLLVVLLAGFGAAIVAARLDPLPPPLAGTARAGDGDSLTLSGERVRLLGIDAPELDQTCGRADGQLWTCGAAARNRLAVLVAAGPTSCIRNGSDRYGRILATCSTAGNDLGAMMVAEGLALSSSGYPAEEAAARAAGRGIWAGRFVAPRQWRDEAEDAVSPSLAELVWTWFRELTGARSLR
jgi:endonuclease YncB( thermonuclease family)